MGRRGAAQLVGGPGPGVAGTYVRTHGCEFGDDPRLRFWMLGGVRVGLVGLSLPPTNGGCGRSSRETLAHTHTHTHAHAHTHTHTHINKHAHAT